MNSPIIIPVIDLFAGPGGLNEGFSFDDHSGIRFKSVLSIEMDSHAHDTLELRAFYRYFSYNGQNVPSEYYNYLAGNISKDLLFEKYKTAAEAARKEAYQATLGETSEDEIHARISNALAGYDDWLLIGGPPCQAYSLAGRVKNLGVCRSKTSSEQEAQERFDNDTRQTLYLQYLKIIATHHPSAFVMENVRGILSAKVHGVFIFPKILHDLREPHIALGIKKTTVASFDRYRIFSFVTGKEPSDTKDFLIRSEEYGLPQARHRVILLGIREDILNNGVQLMSLQKHDSLSVRAAIGDLPELRSGFTDDYDSFTTWKRYLASAQKQSWFKSLPIKLRQIIKQSETLRKQKNTLEQSTSTQYSPDKTPMLGDSWYVDKQLLTYPNHEARNHMSTDLWRYLFVSAYGQANGTSPVLRDFPNMLLPNHKNILQLGDDGNQKFADRFKVQLADEPASTVTSHISKDGHYFIHYDPVQCRSLTVREAARLQTFPDNYFFEGNRTEQYHQVGNAVPPYLAKQLADVVREIFRQILKNKLKE